MLRVQDDLLRLWNGDESEVGSKELFPFRQTGTRIDCDAVAAEKLGEVESVAEQPPSVFDRVVDGLPLPRRGSGRGPSPDPRAPSR